ncbi:unnamed protein product, partial [Scytosiphon promiscuus]
CSRSGCTKQAHHGEFGAKSAEVLCRKHGQDGMIKFVRRSRRCGHPGCTTRPSFGYVKREMCSQHVKH